jgi:hypothetical protein
VVRHRSHARAPPPGLAHATVPASCDLPGVRWTTACSIWFICAVSSPGSSA